MKVKCSELKKIAFHTCLKNEQNSAKFGLVLIKELNLNEPCSFFVQVVILLFGHYKSPWLNITNNSIVYSCY